MMKRNLRFVVFAVSMFTLLITASFLPASAQLSQWRSLNPTRDGRLPLHAPFLYSVQILNANYGWAVGGTCNIYDTSATGCNSTNSGIALFWDGSRWRQALNPGSTGTLTSVFIVNANDVWAVGVNATIIHWDGTSWVAAIVPANTLDKIYSVFILPSGMDGWAVGRDSINGAFNILRWSGNWPTGAWTAVPSPVPAAVLRDVALSSSTDGWAVGRSGVILHWDGLGWTSTLSPTTNGLFAASIISSTDAWAVGASSTIIRWNGASWTGPMIAPTAGIDYHSIHMVNSGDGWIAGNIVPPTLEGLLLRWDGTAWSIVRSYVTENLNHVFMVPGGASGVSVGDAETITHWNGSKWQSDTSPTSIDLNALHLVASNDGWAVGDNGTIFRWDGQSWSHYETLPSGVNLYGLFMRASSDAWAVGASPNLASPPTILRWNGGAWTVVSPPGVALGENLTDTFMLSATEGWAVGTGTSQPATMLKWDGTLWASVPSGTGSDNDLQSIHMLSSAYGWAVGINSTGKGPVIVRWNGLAWSNVTAPGGIGGLNSVHFLNPSNGWAVGNNGTNTQATIIHWDGAQWNRVPGPPGNLTSVFMTSANDGWAVGQNSTGRLSLIVHWDGLTWNVVSTLPLPPTLSVALRSVFMVAPLDGWIVSDQGLILHYGPESVPGTTTSVTTVIQTTTSTSTSATTNSSSTTSSTSTTTSIPPSPVPGFPIESILAGLVGGIATLAVLRRRRKFRS